MAGTNSAFNTKGATPTLANAGLGQSYSPLNFGNYSTPQAKALSSFGNGAGIGQSMIPTTLTPPTNQDIKTHTAADGTSQTYYPSTAQKDTGTPITPEQLANIKANMAATDAQKLGTSPGLISTPPTSGTTAPATTPPPVPTYSGLVTSLADKASQPSSQYTDLTNKAEQAANDAAKTNLVIGQNEQNALHNPEYSLDTGIGRAGQIAANYGLLGQNATARATALGNLANTANTQQGLQQSGLSTAISAAAPVLGQYGQAYYNPLTGETVGGGANGGTLNPLNNITDIAKAVLNGQISPSYAQTLGGTVPNFKGALTQEILKQNPKYNEASFEGNYNARQANTTTSGVTPTNAAASVYGQTYNDLLNIKNTTSNVDQFGNLLIQNMGGINPSDVKYANKTIGEIRSQLSSQQQAQFDTTFAQLKSQIAALLQTGGAQIPTQITADANKIIDGSAPIGTLTATLDRIKTEGNILTSNIQTKLNTAGGVIGAKPQGANNNPIGI